jgi:hypothetical protein
MAKSIETLALLLICLLVGSTVIECTQAKAKISNEKARKNVVVDDDDDDDDVSYACMQPS